MNKTRLILVRHGQSLGNVKNRFLGHTDLDLSEHGYRQINMTADFLKKEKIDAVYASDLKRAYNTVVPVAEYFGVEIIKSEKLREIFAGSWEGMTFDGIEQAFPTEYGIWKNNIGMAVCSNGEAVSHLQERVCSELEQIAKNNTGKTVCIGTHATPIRVFRAKCEGFSPEMVKDIPWASNASVSEFEYCNGNFKMIKYGYDEYLGDLKTVLPKNV